MSEETNTPAAEEVVEAPKKRATKKPEPTQMELVAALNEERAALKSRLDEIQKELRAVAKAKAEAAPPSKDSYQLWLEQKAIVAARKQKSDERSAEVKKVLAELGFTD